MPSVLSIEQINLNGSLLTSYQDRLFINGEQVKNTSGVSINENFFIKGHAPISFYSRWPTVGRYLNEVYLNDFFMVTGYLVSCTLPATGQEILVGRFYQRNKNSVLETDTITHFSLPSKKVFIQEPISFKVEPNNFLGVDITKAPNEIKSISLNLLGYFPAAGHFDKMPKTVNFYQKNEIYPENEIYEELMQYDATFTGINIVANTTGSQNIISEQVIGYISGILANDAVYKIRNDVSNPSGYFINNNPIYFKTGNLFSGFSGEPYFSTISGFEYSGFKLNTGNFQAYSNTEYGLGEIKEIIGWRNVLKPRVISGFLSGFKTLAGNFLTLSQLSSERVSGAGFPLDNSGYAIGSSGYYLGNTQYLFPTGSGLFSGFSGQFGFNTSTGFEYLGFDWDFSNNYFINEFAAEDGYTGKLISNIGYRNEISIEYITGFVLMQSDYNFQQVFLNDGLSGASGYFRNNRQVGFIAGPNFNGFNNQDSQYFNQSLGYEYSGFFINNSGFSGVGATVVKQETVTGFVRGFLNNQSNSFTIFTGYSGQSGILLSGQKFYFPPQKNIEFEKIIGFISGFADASGKFTGLNILNPISGSSGYFLKGNRIFFSTGNFDGFNNQYGFDPLFGYLFSGFAFPEGSGFSGIEFANSGYGIMTGYIGDRNYVAEYGIFSGMSGMPGFDTAFGFEYIVTPETFQYNNLNFIPDVPNAISGIGIITGNIGYKNYFITDNTFGYGIMTGDIGYRNIYDQDPFIGYFYKKTISGNKYIGPQFTISTGQKYNYINMKNSIFQVNNKEIIGIDIVKNLSGIKGIIISIEGFFN